MVTWREVEADAPEFAERVRELFQARKYKTLATLRADGAPRISGIETQIGEPWPSDRDATSACA